MDASVTLTHIKRVTGISRNQLSEVFGYSPNVIAKWEVDSSTLPDDANITIEEIKGDFLAATDALDEASLTWDEVMPARIAAMKLGVSAHTFTSMMRRRRRDLWDFGCLGLWATDDDLAACRQD